MRRMSVGVRSRFVRSVLASFLLLGMCVVMTTAAPVAEAAPPNHPDTSRVETRQFTTVTADLEGITIPANTAAVTVVAQGGQGGGGGSFTAGGGTGGVGGVAFAMSVPVGEGGSADAKVGDNLIIQVGGQAGNQPSGDCRGGNGGNGDGTGKSGGQGGQCSYVKNQRTGEYLAIAGGGGGGGGASGGSVGGGYGGGGGERLNENGNFDASGWPGEQPGGGGAGGGVNRCSSLTPSNGGNGGSAGGATFQGGGGGGGGGCAGGGGGSVSGGGGAGGGSVEIVGRPYHFAPGSGGNGYVTVYFLKGKDNTVGTPESDEGQVSNARGGVTRIPNNAITMQYIATGGAGGGQGGRGATVFGNVPISPTGTVRPGDLLLAKAGNSTAGDLDNLCNGGTGGLENGGGRAGLDGGGCSVLQTSGIGGAPFIFAAGGGGGNGTPNSNGGGDAGQPGGGGAFGAIGGSAGAACTTGNNIAQELSAAGGAGANGGTDGVFNYGGGGGGGGGCRAGGGGGRVSGTGIDGGGGGGGGSYIDIGNGSIFRGPLVGGGGHLAAGNVAYFFTLADKPVFTSANSTTFTRGVAGSFNVTTTGNPTATVVHESGSLPSGVTFTPGVVGSGGGVISGTPQPGTGGTYNIVLKASNVAGDTTQSFTLTVNAPPAFTSPSGVTFTKGTSGSFTVNSNGTPTPTVSVSAGSVPSGVTFTPGANGTASLNYNGAGTGGQYTFTLKSANGISPDALQNFQLTINESPTITSANSHTCQVGLSCNFTVTATGFPAPSISESPTGTLALNGLTYTNNFNGTGTISGTPTSGGVVNVRWVAANGIGSNALQDFTLTINGPPVITSANTATFLSGTNQSFLVTTSSCCNDSVTISRTGGGLPTGVTFVDNGDKTATFSGNPAGTAGGVYTYTLTAQNAFGTTNQTFTLRVHTPGIFTSPNSTTFFVNQPNSFTITTADGFPVPTIAPAVPYSAPLSFLDNGNGTATVSGTPTSEGFVTRTINATNAHSTTSQVLRIDIVKAATTTGLSASPSSPTSRFQPVTFTATVTDATASPGSPTGNVVFSIDGVPQPPVAINPANGQATFTTAALSVGPHTIRAAYQGDTKFLASTSGDLAHQVNQASTSTGVVTSLSPSRLGDNVTFTATVTESTTGVPTGTVQFKDGVVDLGSPVAIDSLGRASISRNNLAIGGHTIFAVYSGDTDFAGSQGSIGQTVNKALSTTNLTAAPSPSAPGQEVTLTAVVTGNPVAGVPVGTVQFKDGVTNLGPPVTLTSGQAVLRTTALPGGTRSLTAVYSGSVLYEPSTGGPLSHSVQCTKTLTGRFTTVQTLSGNVCLVNAVVDNGVKLAAGSRVSIVDSRINGLLSSPNGFGSVVICNSVLSQVTLVNATGAVTIGNPAQGCAANTIRADARVKSADGPVAFFRNDVTGDAAFNYNTGGLTIGGNTFNQDLACSNNNPAPTNGGLLNTVLSLRTGQCRGAF